MTTQSQLAWLYALYAHALDEAPSTIANAIASDIADIVIAEEQGEQPAQQAA